MKTKFILAITSFLVFSIAASAQSGKSKTKNTNNVNSQQRNVNKQYRGDEIPTTNNDSLQSIKSPRGNVKQPAKSKSKAKSGT